MCRSTGRGSPDHRLLADPRYIAEPKLDGQRAQLHVAGGRTVAGYSRPGRELLRHRGLAWLRAVRWPVKTAIPDGELYSGEGAEGIDAILLARGQAGSRVAFAAFDVLALAGRDVMAEPWTDRRRRLEDLFRSGITDPRLQLVPVSDDASLLWRVWVVEWGGEGIVLKDRRSAYRPGTRSRDWWKAKHKLTLPVEVLHCEPELVGRGDWGQAVVMAFAYSDPRSGEVGVWRREMPLWQADSTAGGRGNTVKLGKVSGRTRGEPSRELSSWTMGLSRPAAVRARRLSLVAPGLRAMPRCAESCGPASWKWRGVDTRPTSGSFGRCSGRSVQWMIYQ